MSAALIAWSFLPGLLWLWYVHRHDRFQPEPLRRIVMVFVGGMVATIPAGLFNVLGGQIFPQPGHGVVMSTLDAFVVVGPVEETVKYLAAFFLAYKSVDFDEPIDGLVYSGAAALGFASAENLEYVARFGSDVVQMRAFTAVPGHFIFAGAVGYSVGLARAGHATTATAGLVTAALMHGLYDAFLFANLELDMPVLALGAIAVLIVGAARYRKYVTHLTSLSPFRPGAGNLVCRPCHRLLPPDSRFCDRCGATAA